MTLIFKPIAVRYSVEIDPDSFFNLLEYENLWHGGIGNDHTLGAKIDLLGADGTDYSGHYLNYIDFNVPVELDTTEFLEEVENTMRQHLLLVNTWAKNPVPKPAHYHRGRE